MGRQMGQPGERGQPTRLGETLDRLMRTMGAPPVDVLAQLAQRWPDVVGPALATTTRPVELVDGVLVVACADAALAAQIGWMEGQIADRFTAVFGSDPGGGDDGRAVRRVVARIDR